MGEKIVVGPINKGLKTDREPFYIDNDSFPTLINAYQWRGRIKRKRGTSLLNRLQRNFTNISLGNISSAGAGNVTLNIFSLLSLEATASIVPGNLTNITITIAAPISQTLTNTTGSTTLTVTGAGPIDTASINYATGIVTIHFTGAAAASAVTFTGGYYPGLPVMDLEDLNLTALQFPGTLAFDTTYSYNILTTNPYTIYDVSFYKNPTTGTYPGYVAKTTPTRLTWHGQDYQQFWSANYESAMWVTNGIKSSTDLSTTGMQFKPIITVTVIAGGPPATATLQITAHGLVVGDFVFINEVLTTTGINFQTGYVITVTDANNVIVEFPNATIAGNGTGGIAQYLTNNAIVGVDPIRFYDGDPTAGPHGWVNFSPPLFSGIPPPPIFDDLPPAQYYLVGCIALLPFRDRILFFGPIVQTSTTGPFYLQDTIIYSQNGTPYYTASFTGAVTSGATVFHPILTPTNQGAAANAYFEDLAGYGGFITAGYSQPILTVGPNQDVLMVGFSNRQTKLVYTGNDLLPFNFYIVNSELGSGSTFSTVVMDRGVHTTGEHGIIISNQVGAARIDLEIPDQVFEFSLINNGPQRITAQRDFINDWIYFTYCSNEFTSRFPNQTLLYNYRDNSWGIFNESYTTYGQFRRLTGQTWATLPADLTWATWNSPWNEGGSTLLQPQIIAGNQQGFVMVREDETDEGTSLFIQNIVGQTITSPNHGLNNGDYIVISGVLGTVASFVNGIPFHITVGSDLNSFMIIPLNPIDPSLTYLGGGLITRMYVPLIQTKQFPVTWGMGRKTRIGPQMYCFTDSETGQIELQIYLSTNAASAYNAGNIVPGINVQNNALVYSDILFTCPESTNLGLTPANINLQQVTAFDQEQIWHRMNTSLIGDTIQIGFTLSNDQMIDVNFNNQFAEIELHSLILDVSPSMMLS